MSIEEPFFCKRLRCSALVIPCAARRKILNRKSNPYSPEEFYPVECAHCEQGDINTKLKARQYKKTCKICHQSDPIVAFYSGTSICKSCQKERRQKKPKMDTEVDQRRQRAREAARDYLDNPRDRRELIALYEISGITFARALAFLRKELRTNGQFEDAEQKAKD